MRKRKIESWVVYRTTLKGQTAAINAVCESGEWEAMQAAQPSATLIRSGISSEGEAERLARGTSGDPVPRNASRPTVPPRAP